MKISKTGRNLVFSSVTLVISMIVFTPWITMLSGKTIGYLIANLVYWFVFCIPLGLYFIKYTETNIATLYAVNNTGKYNYLFHIAAFLPVLATFFVVFLPTIQNAPFFSILIALLYALVNGTIEEFFWRGAYNAVFHRMSTAYIIPTILFSLWHIALALANGMIYHGGSFALLGGAAFMGVIWGAVAYKTKTIRFTTIAHVLTNFFAFSGLIYENWFT